MRRLWASILVICSLLLSGAAPALPSAGHDCGCAASACDPALGACDTSKVPCPDGQCSQQCQRLKPALLPEGLLQPSVADAWLPAAPPLNPPSRTADLSYRPPNA